MKKLVLFLYIIFLASCDNNCDDCGTYVSTSYSIVNRLGADINLVFFNQGQNTEVFAENDKEIVLHQLSVVSQEGVLEIEPIMYDSLLINDNKYLKSDCSSIENMLCIENYTLSETKDNLGNTFKDYSLEVK